MGDHRLNGAKIAFFDIETAPNLGYTWGKWEQNVIDFKEPWYILSYAMKWQGQKKITVKALPDYPGYKKNKKNDKKLVSDLWKMMDAADIVIAHNGDSFDIKKANARFIYHGLRPASPHKSIDTLKIARRNFKFDSNKLDDLGKYLRVGKKLPHTGAHLWFGCMAGDPKAWRTMRRYNAQDVALLERVYLKMRPWAGSHPDLRLYQSVDGCPTCLSKNIKKNGRAYAQKTTQQRYNCLDCGKFFAGKTIRIEK